ncbi:uncharacterized protein LOC143072957 isoform X6 [Mytilus galloprovincialis]|uniref:uncharacterized protein LOC143072957 isoform X6 n=1 Tax=Mytilus galloprovincialis TaxID=29158 RepID=UPI003F7B7B03
MDVCAGQALVQQSDEKCKFIPRFDFSSRLELEHQTDHTYRCELITMVDGFWDLDLKEQSNYNARWEFISRLDCSSTLETQS